MSLKKPKMVLQKRRRSSVAEPREQENQTQAEIFGSNLVGSPIQYDSHRVLPSDLLSTAKIGLRRLALRSLYSL